MLENLTVPMQDSLALIQILAAQRSKTATRSSNNLSNQHGYRQEHLRSEDLGLIGFFADVQQQVRPPKDELDKRLPGNDGSLLVKGSPMTIAEALEGDVAFTWHNTTVCFSACFYMAQLARLC